jgi:hypothetical protein
VGLLFQLGTHETDGTVAPINLLILSAGELDEIPSWVRFLGHFKTSNESQKPCFNTLVGELMVNYSSKNKKLQGELNSLISTEYNENLLLQ